MPLLNISTFASAMVMGAQVYERAIIGSADRALATVEAGWTVRQTIVRSIRSPLAGTRRLPIKWLTSASPRTRRAIGGLIYPRHALTHRMKVGLPPSPYGDVLTLHDVTPWTYPDEVTPPPAAAAELRRADAVVTVSQYSAGEIERRFGVQAHVIPNGIDARLLDAPPMSRAQMASLGLHGRYVVVAGGASARKNLDGLAQAWTRLGKRRNGVTLALAGPEHPSRTALFAAMPGALLLGRVPDDLLPRLLAGAEAVIVPSLCEGFGLPALEGMAVGVPVVAANTSALPEVVGDAGLLVDPTPESLAEGIEFAISGDSALVDLASRGRARASQFTWERSVRMHAELWCRIEKGLR